MRLTLITFLLATAALADDEALSRRYHEAYVLEVIEGKPADAAKAYLELLQEKTIPDRLRSQAEFRFAVTCVLLGRADEARARLAALAEREGLPKELRAQVDEYRKAIADVKIGTALETNLQALMLKLGLKYSGAARAHAGGVYREFQILGPRTIPYVRRMLRHSDRDLRWHAFQILARMDVPDLLELWDPDEMDPGDALAAFVRNHPERTPDVERVIRGLKGGMLKNQIGKLQSRKTFSLDFIRWAAMQPECAKSAVAMLAWAEDRVKTEPIVLEWIRSGHAELKRAAASSYLYWSSKEGTKKPADLFVEYCLLLNPQYGGAGLKSYAPSVPPAVRLEALSQVLDTAQADEDYANKVLVGGLADDLAAQIDPAIGTGFAPKEYEKQIRRWLKLIHTHVEWDELDEPLGVMLSVRRVVVALPITDAARLVGDAQRTFGSEEILPVLGFERVEDIPLIRTALKESGYSIAAAVARSAANPHASVAYLHAVARLWPELAPWMGGTRVRYAAYFQALARRLPPKDVQRALLATANSLVHQPHSRGDKTIQRMFSTTHERVEEPGRTYVSLVLAPALPRLFAALPRRLKITLAHGALRYVHETSSTASLAEDRKRIAAAILDALPSFGESVGLPWQWVTPYPDVFPLERWARSPSPLSWRMGNAPLPAAVVRAARYFADDPTRINDSVAFMLGRLLVGDTRKEIAEILGRKADAQVLRLLVHRGLPPSHTLLEKRVLEFNADPDVSEFALAELVAPLVRSTPSPRLFPVVRRLLRSKRASTVMTGMDLATSLGSEELIPSIAPALDSMNAAVREKAKKSIESIMDSRRIKNEIADRLGKK